MPSSTSFDCWQRSWRQMQRPMYSRRKRSATRRKHSRNQPTYVGIDDTGRGSELWDERPSQTTLSMLSYHGLRKTFQ